MATQRQSDGNARLGEALGVGAYNDRRVPQNDRPSGDLRIPLVPSVTDVAAQLGVGAFAPREKP